MHFSQSLTHFPEGRIVTPLRIAAANAAALSFIPPLAALTAAIVAAAFSRSTSSADDEGHGPGGSSVFFFICSLGEFFRTFFGGDPFSIIEDSVIFGTGLLLADDDKDFDSFDPFPFLELFLPVFMWGWDGYIDMCGGGGG
jgi:hypothetical protein